MRVAVVGGGIAGLAAAWELCGTAQVTVFEPGRPGGKIRTTPFGGHPVDEGPDAFLTRQPAAVELCRQLGIEGELVAPAAGHSLLWWRDRLRSLPDGLVLGVPGRLGALATGGILSPAGVARAGLDLVLPRRRPAGDLTVRQLVADRFGAQVADRLVDPLVGGIYAGRTDFLGAAEVTPQLVAAAGRHRSLLRGLRAGRPASSGPVFLAPRLGVGHMVEVLVERLREAGVSFVGEAVTGLHRAGAPVPGAPRAAPVEVAPAGERFDGVVLAVPAPAAAAVLAGAAAGPAAGLGAIAYSSVVLVTAAFLAGDVEPPPGINGFLVPRPEGHLMTACSFASSKWPHWADPGTVLVRMSAGRHGDSRAVEMSDEAVVDALAGELKAATGWRADPSEWRVSRWPGAFPQYDVGHQRRVEAVTGDLAGDLPGVVLAGAAYGGVGVPACITSGRGAARTLLGRLGAPTGEPSPDRSRAG